MEEKLHFQLNKSLISNWRKRSVLQLKKSLFSNSRSYVVLVLVGPVSSLLKEWQIKSSVGFKGICKGFMGFCTSKQTLSKDIIIIIHFDVAVDDANINSF